MQSTSPTRPADPGRSGALTRPSSGGRRQLTKEEKKAAKKRAARRQQELENAAAICDADIRQYSLIFEAVLKSEVGDLVRLEEAVARLQASLAQQNLPVVQPPMDGCDSAYVRFDCLFVCLGEPVKKFARTNDLYILGLFDGRMHAPGVEVTYSSHEPTTHLLVRRTNLSSFLLQ